MAFLSFFMPHRRNYTVLVPYIFLLEGLIELMSLLYLSIRLYKALVITKLMFDQLPLFNPYKWPLSMIRILVEPWFRFWRKVLPPVPVGGHAFDISVLIALEVLELIIRFISFLKFILLLRLEAVLPD